MSFSYQRNGSMPFLHLGDVLFYYVSHGGWSPSVVKTNILKENLHVDESKLSANFLRNLDPERWLDKEEFVDWVKPNQNVVKSFSEEEIKFRTEYVL